MFVLPELVHTQHILKKFCYKGNHGIFINYLFKILIFFKIFKQITQGFDKLKNALWRIQVEFLSIPQFYCHRLRVEVDSRSYLPNFSSLFWFRYWQCRVSKVLISPRLCCAQCNRTFLFYICYSLPLPLLYVSMQYSLSFVFQSPKGGLNGIHIFFESIFIQRAEKSSK